MPLRYLSHPLVQQFLRFALVGLFGTGVQYLCLWVATDHWGYSAVPVSAIGYALGTILNYWLNYFFTFKSGGSHLEVATKYYAVVGIGWCLNTGLMALFVAHWGWPSWPSQALTTGIGLCWNFGGSRFWAFRQKQQVPVLNNKAN